MKKVVKFGGSSLADAGQFIKAGDIVRSDPSRIYVVPSAPGRRFEGDTKVTDMLIAIYEAAAAGEETGELLEAVKARYDSIISGLSLSMSLEEEFETIRKRKTLYFQVFV